MRTTTTVSASLTQTESDTSRLPAASYAGEGLEPVVRSYHGFCSGRVEHRARER